MRRPEPKGIELLLGVYAALLVALLVSSLWIKVVAVAVATGLSYLIYRDTTK